MYIYHAPIDDSLLSEKEDFYSLLECTLLNVPQKDVVILMCDFNAQIGPDNTNYELILGKFAIERGSENGELLLEICTNFDLKIGGSVVPNKNCSKIIWVSSRVGTEIHVRNKRRMDVGSIRTF